MTAVAWIAGQSDAKGTPNEMPNGSSPFTEDPPEVNPVLGLDWDGDAGNGVIQPLIEPVVNGFTNAYKPLYGSVAPAFANAFTAVSGAPLLVVRTAIGGTPLLQANIAGNQNWSPTGVLLTQGANRVLAAIAALTLAGHTVDHVFGIWSQGYRDALIGQDLEDYEAAQIALLDRCRTLLDRPDFQLYTEGNYAPPSANGNFDLLANILTVRTAQLAAIASTDGLHLAFDGGQFFTEVGGHFADDGLHKSQKGLNITGTAMGEYAAQDLFGAETGIMITSHIARLLSRKQPMVYPDPPPPDEATFVRNHPGGQNKVSGTTLAGVLDANVAAGNTLLASFASDNVATSGPNVTGISKPVGELANWVFLGKTGISASGTASVVEELWGIITSQEWSSSFTPTVTIDTARTAKGVVFEEWDGLSLTLRGTVVTATSAGGTPVAATPDMPDAGAPRAGDVIVAGSGWEQAVAITGDSDTTRGAWSAVHSIATAGGLDASNVRAALQHKIVDADGIQSYAPTGVTDSAIVLAVLQPA